MRAREKYARPEYERRFLLDRLPDDVTDPVRIRDRYLHETRLRLRLVETLAGDVLLRKLGQKRRVDPDDPRLVLHTTFYVGPHEYAVLSSLPGDNLVKVRYRQTTIPRARVDVIEEPARGVVLLEASFPDAVSMRLFRPSSDMVEVTDDERHTGRELARPISPGRRPDRARDGTDTGQPGN